MSCPDLGMPFHKTPYKSGNLHIKFSIKFPEKVDKKQFAAISSVLSMQAKDESELSELSEITEVHNLEIFKEEDKNTHV